jgi:glc operon protein GlcG
MKFRITTIAAAGIIALLAGQALAQAPAAPPANPLDVIPDKMPFNTPYGSPITLARAEQLTAAVEAEAKKRDWAFNIAVVDTNGDLVAFKRMDGAQLASLSISQHKARTAARYRRPTKAFEDAVQKAGFHYIATLDDVIASRGGIPLVENGKIIGASGCSGGTGSQDEAVCSVGAALVK